MESLVCVEGLIQPSMGDFRAVGVIVFNSLKRWEENFDMQSQSKIALHLTRVCWFV